MARGGTQGGLNCLTHALPRYLPTPNSVDADGNGYIVIAGRRGPLGRRLWSEREPSTTAVDRRSDKWATSTSADVSVPRLYHYHYLPGFP